MRDRNTFGANIFLCRGVSAGDSPKKKIQKAMRSQSIIGNGRFSNLILLSEPKPEPGQINWRRAIDALVGISGRLWLKLSFKANTIEIK